MKHFFLFLFGWFFGITLVHAQSLDSLYDLFYIFDYKSLISGVTIAIVFSILRTGATLLSAKPVKQVFSQVLGDQVAAFVSGGAMYLILEAAKAENYLTLKPITSLVLVGFAGAMRLAFFETIADSSKKFIDRAIDRIVGNSSKGP